MKDDAPAPDEIPTKRRQLHDVPDYWLAVWASRDNLTNTERARVGEERDRRKHARRQQDVTVGVLVGPEGATPEQTEYIVGYLLTLGATTIVAVDLPAKIERRLDGIPVAGAPDFQVVVRASDVVLAAPRASQAAGVVLDGIRYARHRRVPVRVVLPNGMEG
jgi:hypothetical protein